MCHRLTVTCFHIFDVAMRLDEAIHGAWRQFVFYDRSANFREKLGAARLEDFWEFGRRWSGLVAAAVRSGRIQTAAICTSAAGVCICAVGSIFIFVHGRADQLVPQEPEPLPANSFHFRNPVLPPAAHVPRRCRAKT